MGLRNLRVFTPAQRFTLCVGTEISLNTRSIPAHFPLPAYAKQDVRFRSAFDILTDAVEAQSFPAASVAVTHGGQLVALKAFGRFTYDLASLQTSPATIFDLASLTKVIATTTMAAILYQRGLLDLEMPVSSIVPEFLAEDPMRTQVTMRMLLAHSSGLPAYEKLFLRSHSRGDLLMAAFTTPLVAEPGSHAEYSDIGFIVLGVALERLAGESLDVFIQREVLGPLGMIHTGFNPPASSRDLIAPTADDKTFRHRIIQGEVQDENASVLGGVAAHAGLFSTSEDVAIFATAMLNGGGLILRPETVNVFTCRELLPAETSRALGWDTPSAPSQ